MYLMVVGDGVCVCTCTLCVCVCVDGCFCTFVGVYVDVCFFRMS